jgi:hypothetical protein
MPRPKTSELRQKLLKHQEPLFNLLSLPVPSSQFTAQGFAKKPKKEK